MERSQNEQIIVAPINQKEPLLEKNHETQDISMVNANMNTNTQFDSQRNIQLESPTKLNEDSKHNILYDNNTTDKGTGYNNFPILRIQPASKEISTYELVLFANPRSGSQRARFFTQHKQGRDISVNLKNGCKARQKAINRWILTTQRSLRIMQDTTLTYKVKQFSLFIGDRSVKIIMVTAGGDGSLVGIIQSAKDQGVNIEELVCCPLPYGTGNDLSRVINWGGNSHASHFILIFISRINPKDILIEKLVNEICLNTEEQQINVWKVQVKYRKDGATLTTNSRTRDLDEDPSLVFERYMINYFGLGEDGRLGLEFEKRRTGKRCCNDCCYFWVGFKSVLCGCCLNEQKISNQIDYFSTLPQDEHKEQLLSSSIVDIQEESKTMSSKESQKRKILFTTNKLDIENMRVKDSPVCFVSTNIGSFMGGRSNLWDQSKNKLGIQNPYKNINSSGNSTSKSLIPQFTPQKFDDDILEFNAIYSIIGLSLSKGYRVCQDKGPFEIQFRDQQNRTYFAYLNIDGEYYKMRNPETANVSLATNLTSSGKLTLLARKSKK